MKYVELTRTLLNKVAKKEAEFICNEYFSKKCKDKILISRYQEVIGGKTYPTLMIAIEHKHGRTWVCFDWDKIDDEIDDVIEIIRRIDEYGFI